MTYVQEPAVVDPAVVTAAVLAIVKPVAERALVVNVPAAVGRQAGVALDTEAPATTPVMQVRVTTPAVVTDPVTVMMPGLLPSVGKEPAGTGVHTLMPDAEL